MSEGIVSGQVSYMLSTFDQYESHNREGITYADSPALTSQHPQAVSLFASSIAEVVLLFVIHELYSCCALMTDCTILPRLHEQPLGALSGAGQNGTGWVATGHSMKYSATNSSYSHEYA
jgi:hypothetical protein